MNGEYGSSMHIDLVQRPSSHVKKELSHALQADETELGRIWNDLTESKDEKQIPTNPDNPNYAILNALLGHSYPQYPVQARAAQAVLRSFIAANPWFAPETQAWLSSVHEELLHLIENPTTSTLIEENKRMHTSTQDLQDQITANGGLYVYTYPHYLRFPKEPSTGRTLFRIGKVDTTIEESLLSEETAIAPEAPAILRIYLPNTPTHTPTTMESQLRSRLAHPHEPWHLATLEELDEKARALGFIVVAAHLGAQ